MKRRNRKLTDRRQKKIIYIAAGCIAICLIAASVLFYMGRMSGPSGAGREGGGDRKEASEKSEKTETEDNGSSAGELEIPETEIEQSSDSAGDDAPITVNTDGTVDVSKIEGYASAQEESGTVQDSIRIVSAGSYTGKYVEDGSDEEVSGVLAIVVTNISERFVQYSKITMTNGTDTAVFSLSNLPAGASAVVLAEDRVSAEGTWSYQDDTTAFIDAAETYPDIFEWQGGDYQISLRNKSGETYDQVYVYYKNTENGIYLGGITYRISFDGIGPGQTMQKASKHFSGSNSHVMMIDYID